MTDYRTDHVIPGLAEIRAARSRVNAYAAAHRGDLPMAGALDRQIVDMIRDAAKSGADQLPDDFADQLALQRARAESHARLGQLIETARQHLDSDAREVQRRGVDHGLRWLHGKLPELLAGIRDAAAPLRGLASAEDAMATRDAGRMQAWMAAEDAVKAYQGIRHEQLRLFTLAAGGAGGELQLPGYAAGINRVGYGDVLRIVGEISNIGQCWPQWRRATRNEVFDTLPPWPVRPPSDHEMLADARPPRPLEPVIGVPYLLWLADSQAKPWVPTIGQATACYVEQHQAADDYEKPKAPAVKQSGRRPVEQLTR